MSLQINCLACHILAKKKLLSSSLASRPSAFSTDIEVFKNSDEANSSVVTKQESTSNIFPLKKTA